MQLEASEVKVAKCQRWSGAMDRRLPQLFHFVHFATSPANSSKIRLALDSLATIDCSYNLKLSLLRWKSVIVLEVIGP